MITVLELIEKLKKFPEEAKVYPYEGEFIGIVIVRELAFGEELAINDRRLKYKEIGSIELVYD